jgi:hypothetical protein
MPASLDGVNRFSEHQDITGALASVPAFGSLIRSLLTALDLGCHIVDRRL